VSVHERRGLGFLLAAAAVAASGVAMLTAAGLAAGAATRPPTAGVLVPGKSLGGLALGATQTQVRQAWGSTFGRCRDCAAFTWYFNFRPFRPEGAGVEFRGGRVAGLFTLWSPEGWRTTRGLRIGDNVARATALHGALVPVECGTYRALTIQQPRAVTAFYVVDDRIWAFGLSRPGVPVCR
jgi:hypothetical protein